MEVFSPMIGTVKTATCTGKVVKKLKVPLPPVTKILTQNADKEQRQKIQRSSQNVKYNFLLISTKFKEMESKGEEANLLWVFL